MDVPYAWLLDRQFELEILEATVLSTADPTKLAPALTQLFF